MKWIECNAGDELPPRQIRPITRTDIVRYQGASGDFQPIHHDEPFARAAGYDAPLGIGMLHAGALAGYVAAWAAPEAVRRVKLRFQAPVFSGDTLTLSGRVLRTYAANDERRMDIEMRCVKSDGTEAVVGEMTLVVSER